jgi:hypothetical protein
VFDEDAAKRAIVEAYDAIANEYPDRQITIVSGLTNVGILALAYAEAAKRGWRTVGITSKKALTYDCFPVDESQIVGEDWGDESPTFVACIDVIIRIGGGKQSHAEVALIKEAGKPVYEYDIPILG